MTLFEKLKNWLFCIKKMEESIPVPYKVGEPVTERVVEQPQIINPIEHLIVQPTTVNELVIPPVEIKEVAAPVKKPRSNKPRGKVTKSEQVAVAIPKKVPSKKTSKKS